MDGWLEWLGFLIAMIVVGIGLLAFVAHPLLAAILAAIVGLAYWVASDARPARRRGTGAHLDQ